MSAINHKAKILVAIIAMSALSGTSSAALAEGPEPEFPLFRQLDRDPTAGPLELGRSVTLLTDQDFAPWSFVDADGALRGVSIDLARQACAELGLSCAFKSMPFGALRKALADGGGDAIVSGLKADEQFLDTATLTRPYFLALGRFMTRQGTSLPSSDTRALAGKRIGFVRNSAHGAFLQKHYAKSELGAYDTLASAQEALRTGAVDAIFGDALAMAYWQAGTDARKCCQPLGKAFIDRDTFSRGLFFSVRADQQDLRDAFDQALDVLEERGDTARIFTAYLPGPVW
jgi:polar amino acid transport system substrate-binding protein